MKKNKYYIFVVLIVVLLICGIFFFHNKKEELNNSDYIKYEGYYKDYYKPIVFTNYYDYYNELKSDKLSSEDFVNNNYVFIRINYDSCGVKNIKSLDYTINGNNINVTVKYTKKCDKCAYKEDYYLLKVDKNITTANVDVEFKATNLVLCDNSIKKPLIYLYPEEKTNVSVKLVNDNLLTTTYPKYNNSWNVLAYPDGKLIDLETNRELYGLYWEGKNSKAEIQKDGFVVKGSDTINFLEEKLKTLGLTDREANEFIIYWLPILENNKYNYIRFETIEEINEYMPLIVNPKPDTIIRIVMDYKPLDKKINVIEQKLETPIREGFVLVEWGGTKIN